MIDTLYDWAHKLAASPPALALAALVGAYVVARILTRVLGAVLTRVTRRTRNTWDDQVVARLSGPVSGLLALQMFRAALEWIAIGARAASLIERACTTAMVAIVIWGGFRAVELARNVLMVGPWAIDHPGSKSLITLGSRFAKVAVLVFGSLIALSELGVSVASLIAGLGIGGLVFALAAQKTVENVFGAVSIGIDQPMREGDFVHIYDFVGTVEKIGLRSSRIRTLDRTLVTVPNGDLSNQRVESYTARDRIRLSTTIGLEYATSAAQMREVLAALEAVLRAHPKIWPDTVVVRFSEFAASSLDITVMAWFQTTDYGEFQAIRQDILLSFMDAIERAGTSIAFPTRTVHVVNPPEAPAPPAPQLR